ncbi:hypothetical protein Tcan_08269 [Toxocara canis]|uniref:Uncharacterized protein n=1 Tax=Toxocara canis TaxID=6265 RepID=A0A0B2UZP6_TOXCA|nr:hypothetical protein Tcan_08269 [Toxocara canis]
MVDQIGEESTELIIERPRYAHAVMVLTNGDEPGELLTASRIKVLDPIFIPIETASNGHQVFHQYCSESERPVSSKVDAQREDDDIERALQRLEKSRNMLDEPAQTKSNCLTRQTLASDLLGDIGSTTHTGKPSAYQFPSELRHERRAFPQSYKW